MIERVGKPLLKHTASPVFTSLDELLRDRDIDAIDDATSRLLYCSVACMGRTFPTI